MEQKRVCQHYLLSGGERKLTIETVDFPEIFPYDQEPIKGMETQAE
jgi:hypothetical protein